MGIWKRYEVELQVTNELMAGIPKNPDLIGAWLESRQPTERQFEQRKKNGEQMASIATLTETVAEEVDSTGGEEDKSWRGFKKDDAGLYIEGSNVKAHIKDCANVLQKIVEIRGLRSKVANRVYVEDERVHLGVQEPTDFHEHPVHVMTRQGPRSALKRNDYVDKPRLCFVLKLLDEPNPEVDEDLLRSIFEYGGTHGIGAERGIGYGRYTLEKLEEVA